MNTTRPLSPFLQMLVEEKTLDLSIAEQFNQLRTFELQQRALAQWPDALTKAAIDLCGRLAHPEGKILYQAPPPSSSTPGVKASSVKPAAIETSTSRKTEIGLKAVVFALMCLFMWGGFKYIVHLAAGILGWIWGYAVIGLSHAFHFLNQ